MTLSVDELARRYLAAMKPELDQDPESPPVDGVSGWMAETLAIHRHPHVAAADEDSRACFACTGSALSAQGCEIIRECGGNLGKPNYRSIYQWIDAQELEPEPLPQPEAELTFDPDAYPHF